MFDFMGSERVLINHLILNVSAFLQFVFVSLAGWGALFYGCYKFFTSGPSKGGAGGGDKKGETCPPGMERVRKH